MTTALRRVAFAAYCLWLGPFWAAAQAPIIDNFNPTSGSIGTAVTINGSNFSTTPASNIVYFGAVRATVASADVSSLVATAPAGATYQPLKVTIAGLTAASKVP